MAIRDAGGDLNTRSNCKNRLKILPITKPDNILYMTKQKSGKETIASVQQDDPK